MRHNITLDPKTEQTLQQMSGSNSPAWSRSIQVAVRDYAVLMRDNLPNLSITDWQLIIDNYAGNDLLLLKTGREFISRFTQNGESLSDLSQLAILYFVQYYTFQYGTTLCTNSVLSDTIDDYCSRTI